MIYKPRIPVEAFLCNLPLFKGYAQEQIRGLAADVDLFDAPRGTAVFGQGDSCQGIYFVVFGQAKLVRQAEGGAEMVLELVGAGESLAAETMFLNKPYGATAHTLADTKVVHLSRRCVLAEMQRSPEFAQRMAIKLSQRLEHLIEDLESIVLRSARQRVVTYLLKELPDVPEAGDAALRLPASKGIIASRLHLTHEHFSRVLHELAGAGLIAVDGRQIAIPDVGQLRASTSG